MRGFMVALAALAWGLVGAVGANAATISAPQTVIVTSGAQPQARTYVYYKPDNFGPAKGMIIVLHGGGGTGLIAAGPASDELFEKLADRVGVLVVFPDGIAGGWNSCSSSTSEATRPDDVAFIRALIPQVQQTVTGPGPVGLPVGADGNHVYVFGHSEGSKMAERLALEANDVIAAVGVMAGNLPVANDNTPDGSYKCAGYDKPWGGGQGGRAVPLFLFKGDMDPRIPFGQIATSDAHPDVAPDHNQYCQVKDNDPATCKTGLQHSYYETVAFWQWKLGLSASKTDTVAPNGASGADSLVHYADTVPMCPSYYPTADQVAGCGKVASDKSKQPTKADFQVADGSSVVRYTYGPAPYRLVFDRVLGGGHCFPGPSPQAPPTLPANAVTGGCGFSASGWKNRDTLVTQADPQPYVAEKLWTFFRQFSLMN